MPNASTTKLSPVEAAVFGFDRPEDLFVVELDKRPVFIGYIDEVKTFTRDPNWCTYEGIMQSPVISEECKAAIRAQRDWVTLSERLPKCRAFDMFTGGTRIEVKFKDGSTDVSSVLDHNTWELVANECGITHWRYLK